MVLENIYSPTDVKRLTEKQTELLCIELRQFLIEQISRTGGHLASNLGAVELTVAIHRVFDTSTDRLVFDVGHQCYVHKALTGRRELFSTLRQFGGLSVCAKSGTAEREGQTANAMFAGFALDSSCPVAFVVFVENGGSGSAVAAPMAAKVLQACAQVLSAEAAAK